MSDPIANLSKSSSDVAASDDLMHPEQARAEYARFLKRCSIRHDKDDKQFADRVVGYIRSGVFVIDEDGAGTYTLQSAKLKPLKSITFDEPDGRVLSKIDEMRNESYRVGMMSFIAAFGDTTAAVISKVKKQDIEPLQDIAALFLG